MIGASAVGKTSLVSRFVRSIFSDKYHTTVGVKIDKKVLRLEESEITLLLWDLAGEDEFLQIRMSYLRGSSGYLLVADGTRRATLEVAFDLKERIEREYGEMPFILALNKGDLEDEWEIDESEVEGLLQGGWSIIKTSAKTGECVEDMFLRLAGKMVHNGGRNDQS